MMKLLIVMAIIVYIRILLMLIRIFRYWASEYDKKLLDNAYRRHKAKEYIRRKNAKKK